MYIQFRDAAGSKGPPLPPPPLLHPCSSLDKLHVLSSSKNERHIFLISALAYNVGRNKKLEALYYFNYLGGIQDNGDICFSI